MRAALAVTLLCAAAAPIQAQMHHGHTPAIPIDASTVDVLIEKARSAAGPYVDRSAAIADGYRRVGRELPMMGEHWLNTRLLVDGTFDITHPQVLTYLDIGGKPVLTGVVFAVVLDSGESPPATFGSTAIWHEHNGSVDEEALVPEHHTAPSEVVGTRVSFLHVWTHVVSENVFGAENWALPFVRAGVKVPAKFSNHAARCMGIQNGGRDYYLAMPGAQADPASFDECAVLGAKIANRARTEGRAPTESELGELETAWRIASNAIERHR